MSETTVVKVNKKSWWQSGESVKHLLVLLILGLELVPFLTMMQISVKDNTTFQLNNFLPPNPYTPPIEEQRERFEQRVAEITAKTGTTESEVLYDIIRNEKAQRQGMTPRAVDATLRAQLETEAAERGVPEIEVIRERAWDTVSTARWRWENFEYGLGKILPYVANTVFVAVFSAAGTLFCALIGAYFFARYKMPGSDILWMLFLFLMLMPGVANIVPLFALLKEMNLLNTLWALIIVHVAGGQVFNMFVLRNFIEEIPRDLFEAAEMDGASHWQQIRHIVVPMSQSIIGTLAILIFIGSWNEFLLPLIVLNNEELFTIGVGLIYLDGEYIKQWGLIMASFVIASIPLVILFLLCMKLFIQGLTSGAVKG